MRWKVLLAICVTLMFFGAVLTLDGARRTAARMRAQGRLSQLHLALLNYETANGVLPNRTATDSNCRPLFSWVAAVLPYIEQSEIANSLDFSHAWNSPANEKPLARGEGFWNWYSEDGYFICTFDGSNSLWDANGAPLGKLADYPTHILLIATTIDGIHPLEPFSMSEKRLRELLKTGHRVIYVDADRIHGIVKLESDSIVFTRRVMQ